MKQFPLIALWMGFGPLLRAEIPSEAYITQTLFDSTGGSISTITPLDSGEGTTSSLPLEGVLAKFELYVYPYGEEDAEVPVAVKMDEQTVGVLPRTALEFTGLDQNEAPRTRADQPFTIDLSFLDSPTLSEEEGGQEWTRHFVLRKRYLDEEHIGAADADDHWVEDLAIELVHTEAGQSLSLSERPDRAQPEGAEEGWTLNKWSGIQEYVLGLSDYPGTPVEFLPLKRVSVRVWPAPTADYENIEDGAELAEMPSLARTSFADVYPGAENIKVTLSRATSGSESFAEEDDVVLYEEDWTAVVSQDRLLPLDTLPNYTDPGSYRLRATTTDPFGEDQILKEINWTLGGSSFTLRGRLHSLE